MREASFFVFFAIIEENSVEDGARGRGCSRVEQFMQGAQAGDFALPHRLGDDGHELGLKPYSVR